MRGRRGLAAAALIGAGMLAASWQEAQACTIDGAPTLTVNGYAAILNKQAPVGKGLAVWAPFKLSFPLHVGRSEVIAEKKGQVPLPLEGFKVPWRWTFGDGSPVVRGMSVRHTFRKPGVYKILVEAYFPSHKFWYPFDALQVTVLKGS
jgi:PKD domain-containing protein